MPTWDPKSATVHVFTEKEGLLSAVAHDLELEVTDFQVTADDASVSARFNAKSLRVLHALKDGRPSPALKDEDKADIQDRLVKDVLHSAAHPQITFTSSSVRRDGPSAVVNGNLTLHGTTKQITALARLQGESWVLEVPLHQPDYGIKPYSAMMGTLKVKPLVRVRVTVPKW